MSTGQFAKPEPYWVVNDTDLSRLRQQLAQAEADVTRATTWVERTRAEQHAKSVRRELQGAETQRRTEASQHQLHTPAAAKAGNVSRERREQRFAPCVAYFAPAETKATPRTRRADNAAPMSFEQLNAAVQFAREAGLFRR